MSELRFGRTLIGRLLRRRPGRDWKSEDMAVTSTKKFLLHLLTFPVVVHL